MPAHDVSWNMPKPPPDELSLCSEQVRDMFKNAGSWFIGTPTMVQLSLDIRELVKAVNKLEETVRRQRG